MGGFEALWIQADGRILAGNAYELWRFHPDGAPDAAFGGGGRVELGWQPFVISPPSVLGSTAVAFQPDGHFVLAGNAPPGVLVQRYTPDGGRDAAFGRDGGVAVAFGRDGARDATLDRENYASTPGGGAPTVQAIHAAQSGALFVLGRTLLGVGPDANSDMAIVRLLASGQPDRAFGDGGVVTTELKGNEEGRAAVLTPRGQLVIAGATGRDPLGGTLPADVGLWRYTSEGVLDPSFGSGGQVVADFGGTRIEEASAVILQPDGRLVVAVTGRDLTLARFEADGSDAGASGTLGTLQ
jgi:uncharacterized delta-60 repeat protein